jgi:hypothetical protein
VRRRPAAEFETGPTTRRWREMETTPTMTTMMTEFTHHATPHTPHYTTLTPDEPSTEDMVFLP